MHERQTIYKYDRIWIGIIIGLVVPSLGFVIVYLVSVINHYTVGEDIVTVADLLKTTNSLVQLAKFLSVGCMLNIGAFFLFINRDYYRTARGIIFATLLVAAPILMNSIKNLMS